MSEILKGSLVSEELIEKVKKDVEKLNLKGLEPTLAIIGIGNNPSDLSYKKGIVKKADLVGVKVKEIFLDENVSETDYVLKLKELNNDSSIHGILMLRPLPKHFNEDSIRNLIDVRKDIDGCSNDSLSSIFVGDGFGFPPCTAEACMKILEFYNIDVTGKNVCILGRSLVIGKPVSMMLVNKNATVTICHSKTKDVCELANKADILISSVGKLKYVNSDFVNERQIVIDVGINWDEEKGKIAGDCDFDSISTIVEGITPVPGGIGAITSTLLISHVVTACERLNK